MNFHINGKMESEYNTILLKISLFKAILINILDAFLQFGGISDGMTICAMKTGLVPSIRMVKEWREGYLN